MLIKPKSLTASLLLSLCVPAHGLQAQEAANSYGATRVLVGECLFKVGSGESAIGAALLTFGIEKAFNVVGAALRSAGADKPVTYTGTGNLEQSFDQFNDTCVIVIRGRFGADVSQDVIDKLQTNPPPWAAAMGLTGAHLTVLAQNHRALLTAQPEFMFEGVFNQSDDKSAFTMRPLFVALNKPYEQALLSRSAKRHVAVLFSIVPPGNALDEDSNPGAEIVLGELRPRSPIRFRFPELATEAAVAPAAADVPGTNPADDVNAGGRYVAWPQESRWFNLDANETKGPLTLRAVVTETRTGSALFKFLADAFDAVKKDAAADVGNALIPSQRRTARAADITARNELRSTYIAALQTALTSLNQCATSTATSDSFADQTSRLGASQTARAAQDAANAAALLAEEKEPFPSGALVPYSPAAAVIQRCTVAQSQALSALGGTLLAEDTTVTGGRGEGGDVLPDDPQDNPN